MQAPNTFMPIHNSFPPDLKHGQFAVLPAQGTLRAGYLSGLKSLVRNLGGDLRDVLEQQELDPFTFDDPDNNIECIAAVNLLEYCSSLLEDRLFGLHLAEQQVPDAYGCVVALARAATDMRQALQCLVDYTPMSTSPECEMELVTAKDTVELRWRTHIGFGDCQQVNYHGLLLTMKTLQMLGGPQFRPRYASLTFPVSRNEKLLLQDKLGCRINSKADANAIAFSSDILDLPITTSNRTLYAMLENSLVQLNAATKASFVEQVEACVRRELGTGSCSVDSCAEKLGTSTRTLQKRLTRIGVKFSDIIQSERIKLAKQALLWGDATLDEISYQLGYSEQTSFGRAFKRSTGLTPNAYRLAMKQRKAAG